MKPSKNDLIERSERDGRNKIVGRDERNEIDEINERDEKKLIAGWSLTNMCNLKCMHCYNDSGKRKDDELSTEEALQVVDKLAEANVTAVNFGGGECALRPDFLDICRALVEKGIDISYTTNGTTLDRIENDLDLFHDVGVSIDFADSGKHDLFRGCEGTYEQAIEAIDKLVANGVSNEIVTCLTKLNSNEEELSGLYDIVKEHNVDSWRLNRYRATGRALYNDSFLGMNSNQLKRAFDFLDSLRDDKTSTISEPLFRAIYGGSYQIGGDPSGLYSFRIQTNGEVTPSVFLSKSGGNIRDKSIDEIMQSDVFKDIREREAVGKCVGCNEYYHCQGGDAGISLLMNGHYNGPDPMCFKDTSLPKNKDVIRRVSEDPNVHELYLCTLYIAGGNQHG